MLATLTIDAFKPYLNQTFHLADDAAHSAALELIQLSPLGAAPPNPAERRAFSLVFREPTPHVRPQGIYSLAHPQMGTLDLFLVPIGPDATGMCYEAVFT